MPLVQVNRALLRAPYLRMVKGARGESRGESQSLEDRMKDARDLTVQRRKRWRANGRRIGTTLKHAGILSRAMLLTTRFDTWSTYRDIQGIGDVLGRQLRIMVNLYSADEWEAVTGIAYSEAGDDEDTGSAG